MLILIEIILSKQWVLIANLLYNKSLFLTNTTIPDGLLYSS